MSRIEKIASSYLTMMLLLALYAIGLSTATLIEKAHGSTFAKVLVYYSPLFFFLQFLLIVNFVMIIERRRLLSTKRWGMLLVHFSFMVILLGASLSHFFGVEGTIHLREGEKKNHMLIRSNHGNKMQTFPFDIELEKFVLKRYPGSMSPSSYESNLLIYVDGEIRKERVFMNNVLDLKGYRFYQASFDADERGTILSVNKDVAGRNVTYTGYVLLIIGFIGCFIAPKSRLRYLINRMKHRTFLFFFFISLIPVKNLYAEKNLLPMIEIISQLDIPKSHLEHFQSLPVQSMNGRMIPVNTFSSEILRKLHKNNTVYGINADRFLLSLLAMPQMWMNIPFIALPNNELAEYYDLSKNECAYSQLFHPDGSYKLQARLEEAYRKIPTERSGFDRDVIKLDEQINIFHQIANKQLLRIFPNQTVANDRWHAPGDDLSAYNGEDSVFVSHIFTSYLSEVRNALKSGDWTKADNILNIIKSYQEKQNHTVDIDTDTIRLELIYNKVNFFRWCKIGYLSLGGLMLILSFLLLFKKNRNIRYLIRLLSACTVLVFIFHLIGMGIRWKIGGYAPWSNSYETMVYVAWATVLAGGLFMRRNTMTFALATLFAGVILFVSSLNWMDPQINPLVPVLKSPWLMFHVAVLMVAYGFFGIGCLIGITNLIIISICKKEQLKNHISSLRELTVINEISLLIGLILMTIGTFMGAVWANESWGRYWGWDPKETWALITMVIYAMVTHLHLLPRWYNLWSFNLSSTLAFASVLMTYFGVNYFLSGMHSYGQNDSIQSVFVYLYIIAAVVLVLAITGLKGKSFKINHIKTKKRDEIQESM